MATAQSANARAGPRNDLLDLLVARRSVGRVLAQRPSRGQIERLLEAGCAAPNHHRTQPWRFVVVTGQAREQLGEALRDALKARLGEPDSLPNQALLAKEVSKPLRAPVIIAVAIEPSNDPRVFPAEELASGAAAAQNILLAAAALGLGAMWRTGETAYDPIVKAVLGLGAEHAIIGLIYVGFPDAADPTPAAGPRRSWAEVTRWWGWEDNPKDDPER